MSRILVCMMAIAFALSLSPQTAKAAGVEQEKDFGKRLTTKHYIGAGFIVPKEGDIDVGPSAIYGIAWIDNTNKESAFLDVAFSQSGLSNSVLWTRNDVRQLIVRLGYKWEIKKHNRWQYGFDLQRQRMDFGSRRISALSFGALLEYKMAKRWSAQFESSQFSRKSNVRFGVFQANIVRYF